MFIIHDKKLNELIGQFETYNKAFIYYMSTNFLERLKMYRNLLLNKELIQDNIRNLRQIEILISDTLELLNDENPSYELLQNKFCLANDYLNNPEGEKFKLTLNIIRFDENIRDVQLY